MNLFDTTHIGLERALSGAAARQSAIAENLANVNTPGYRRKDVDFHSTLRQAFVRGGRAVEEAQFAATEDPMAPVRPDGGTVDIDREAAEQARAGLEYEALASVLKARAQIIKSALGVG